MHTAKWTQLAEGFSFPEGTYHRDWYWLQRMISSWLRWSENNPSINLQSLLKVIDSAGIEVNSDNVVICNE